MCGIYGLLSARIAGGVPGEELFGDLESFLESSKPQTLTLSLGDEGGIKRVVESLDMTRLSSNRWTSRGAALALCREPALEDRLRVAARRLRQRAADLAEFARSARVPRQAQREIVNRLVIAAKDLAWQIEHDILENVETARTLVQDDPGPTELGRAYELNLTLRGLDRLEVRGRDSAGIAIYVRFPSSEALDNFLDARTGRRLEFDTRRDSRFGHWSIARPCGAPATLLFGYKVASEVGKMGENVSFLRGAIQRDGLLQALLRETTVDVQSMAHTRWASNGVISIANCHPVDSAVHAEDEDQDQAVYRDDGLLVACLNGDIDNYRELVERHVHARGLRIDPAVTTDAKIVPIVVAHHLEQTGDLELAFRLAMDEFKGSMAIGLMAATRPGQFFFAQKGSGQGLYFGFGGESVAVASEMYGVVELTSVYARSEGTADAAEVYRLTAADRTVNVDLWRQTGFVPMPEQRLRTAEITTRDIDRGDHSHFFVKEIRESVESVRNTVRGKFELAASQKQVRFLLGDDILPVELVAGLRSGSVSRIALVGQGTAAIAAEGIASLLERALARLSHPVAIRAEKATEFSAHRLRQDMSDTLVVAVSQSGSTTDTNRAVDLARERGAWILSIVNRRNSDLVYKSHGVLYTSDGRDVEMSVASTKAFYSQNVAGQILALTLGSALGTMTEEELCAEALALEDLPAALAETLERQEDIARVARDHALSRRHWAVVGGGDSKIAAEEIRIKLSELCYKSIAVDFVEDKKHIDLSSEPLIVVCAAGLPPATVADVAKEVAIFDAHHAVPIVIADEDERRFDSCAAAVVRVPRVSGALGYLPTVIAGHLLGYHAAASIDEMADHLRGIRGALVRRRDDEGFDDTATGFVLESLPAAAVEGASIIERLLVRGQLDAALDASAAIRLDRALQLILGRIDVDTFVRGLLPGASVLDRLLGSVSTAIAELSRPIDAIRHQAKTVTVGVSRPQPTVGDGPLWRTLAELGIRQEYIRESHRAFLSALEPLVSSVEGVTLYRLTELDALGRPQPTSRIRVIKKLGASASMLSRADAVMTLGGSKWEVVKHREIYLGYGHADRRKILMLPAIGDSTEGFVVLLHLTLVRSGDRQLRLKALRARQRFFDRLLGAVTELNLEWDPALIDAVDNDALFLQPAPVLAADLASTVTAV